MIDVNGVCVISLAAHLMADGCFMVTLSFHRRSAVYTRWRIIATIGYANTFANCRCGRRMCTVSPDALYLRLGGSSTSQSGGSLHRRNFLRTYAGA